MALATLSIDLVAQLADLQAGMDKAGRLAEKSANEIEARYARLSSAAAGIGAALATAIPVAGLAAFFRTTVNGLDALNDLKDSTGASIENLSALEDIAARTGTSMDTVTTGLLKFNSVLGAAKPGSDAAETLKRIGLNAEELKRIDPAEALRRTAVALAGYADDGERARLVQDLFGKSTKEFAAYIKELADQGKLNATVTKQQAEEAEKFNKQMAALTKNSQDFARSMVSDLVPALNQFFARLQGINRAGGFFASIGKELKSEVLGDELRRVVKDIEAVQTAIDRQGGDAVLEKRLAGLRAEASRLSRESAETAAWLKRFAQEANPYIDPRNDPNSPSYIPPGLPLPRVPDRAGSKDKAAKVYAEAPFVGPVLLPMQITALKALEQTDLFRITALRAELEELLLMQPPGGSNPVVAEAIQTVLGKIQALDPAARAAAESVGRINAVLAATPAAKLADARRLVDELQRELERTSDPERARQIGQAMDQIYESIGAIPAVAEPVFAELDEYTKRFAENIQDALGQTFLASMDNSTQGVLKLWGNMLKRMVAEAAAADLARALFPNNESNKKKSGLADLIGSVIGIFAGGSSGNPDTTPTRGGRALGGGVAAGGMYPVLEKGLPELLTLGGRQLLLMGKQGGQITPLSQAGGGGGGITVQVVNNGRPADVESTSQTQTGNGALIKVVLREAASDVRRGGALAAAGAATWGVNRAAGAPRRG